MAAGKGVLRYLKGIEDLAIPYSIDPDLTPKAYYNSNYAGCKETAKSTYSYIFIVAGRPVSWKSKRSTTIALSIYKAEYNALIEAVQEIQWLHGLYKEL